MDRWIRHSWLKPALWSTCWTLKLRKIFSLGSSNCSCRNISFCLLKIKRFALLFVPNAINATNATTFNWSFFSQFGNCWTWGRMFCGQDDFPVAKTIVLEHWRVTKSASCYYFSVFGYLAKCIYYLNFYLFIHSCQISMCDCLPNVCTVHIP